MAYISCRPVNGVKYFYKVEGYRVGRKVRHRILEYYGRKDPRKDLEASPIVKKNIDGTCSFGDIALLYRAADEINLFEVIDTYVPKRQGLPLSLEFFLTSAHKLLDDKPSSANLSPWVEDTHLPSLLGFDTKRITENTQQYLMNKIYDEERNIDHLYRISIDLYKNATKLFGKEDDTYFYDITSTYFEGKCCPLAFFGHNKDGKPDKLQINIAMIMNGAYGIPIVSKVV
ncbi:protein containing transposase [mine drainage metagenome]|uniref:Protein containing transposase n=1 Tax=mine drainage metagenome TaxID=410659 RepID=T1AB51_9ZZZZ